MENTKQMGKPKKFNLLEWTTIIYAFLTFLGYSYIDSYYNNWGIHIYSFLEASEILLIFLNNLNSLLLTIGSLGFVVLCVFYLTSSKNEANREQIKSNVNKMPMIIVYIIVIAIPVVFGLLMTLLTNAFSSYVVTSLVLILTFYVVANNKLDINVKYLTLPYNKRVHQIFLLIVCLLISNIIFANYHYKSVINKQSRTLFSFTNESVPYKSNDSLLFIGATSKYIFIRNTKDSTNLIFDKSGIINLSLTEKHSTNK